MGKLLKRVKICVEYSKEFDSKFANEYISQ